MSIAGSARRVAAVSLVVLPIALFGGCVDIIEAPTVPSTAVSLSPDNPILDRETLAHPSIRFYDNEESFVADRGEVEEDYFDRYLAPRSSCARAFPKKRGPDRPHEPTVVPLSIENPLRIGPDISVASDACVRTERRWDSDRPAIIIEAPGFIKIYEPSYIRGILLEFEGSVGGEVVHANGVKISFEAHAQTGSTAVLGVSTDLSISQIRFDRTVALRRLLVDVGWEEREEAVVKNMHLVAEAFERFASAAVGRYPSMRPSATCGGKELRDIFPGGEFPQNPFSRHPTSFMWDATPHYMPGSLAATSARPWTFVIQGRGRDLAYLPEAITPPPLADRVLRNMRVVQSSLEEFAAHNGGIYPTSAEDTTTAGQRTVDLMICPIYPYNPYPYQNGTVEITPVSWNTDAEMESGAIAILEATPDHYLIRGRGDDPNGYIDEVLTPNP